MAIQELKNRFGNEIDGFDIYELLEAIESEGKIIRADPINGSKQFWLFKING